MRILRFLPVMFASALLVAAFLVFYPAPPVPMPRDPNENHLRQWQQPKKIIRPSEEK